MEPRVGIESTSEAREGWFRLLGSSSAKASADLRQSPTPPRRNEFRELAGKANGFTHFCSQLTEVLLFGSLVS